MKSLKHESGGSILVSIIIITIFIGSVIFSLLVLANSNLFRARSRIFLLQAQYAAESGADSVVAQLNSGNDTYTGQGTELTVMTNAQYRATYTTTVAAGASAKEKIVTAVGRLYTPASSTTATYTRSIEVTVQRSSATTSQAIVSRNIVDIDSGVKNIEAKDIYVNGYIKLNKNTTNLIAENITVADRNTGAGSCSIGGSGNLLKPAAFTTPGQTKTNINVAFNNCISPPGNISNADFNVTANLSTISKVQSTYIPWSQFMDNSYQNAPGGCNDWTSGVFPRDIPSTGNTKKTHYPDDLSTVSTSCGTSGNLNLTTGQYNIRDHVHLRANLCGSAGCEPTFHNPDAGAAGVKFVFVEGTINFKKLTTTAGSGPIVFVSYGTDPAALAGACPLGASIYLGNSSDTNAPDAYFIANNGVCLDKTKFAVSPALGGLSGKNIYVATNPGTPFDLSLDPFFPTETIPIDLAWRAARYRRI